MKTFLLLTIMLMSVCVVSCGSDKKAAGGPGVPSVLPAPEMK